MAVAHFPSGSVLTWSTFFETANAGDVITSSDAIAPQVASAPLRNDASPGRWNLRAHLTPPERAMTRSRARACWGPRASERFYAVAGPPPPRVFLTATTAAATPAPATSGTNRTIGLRLATL